MNPNSMLSLRKVSKPSTSNNKKIIFVEDVDRKSIEQTKESGNALADLDLFASVSDDSHGSEDAKKPAVTFTGTGFLCLYSMGVAQCLRDQAPHLLQHHLGGSSSGSLVALCVATNTDLQIFRKSLMDAIDKSQNYVLGPFNPFFNLENCLIDSLLELLPADAHVLASGKLHVSLTRASTLKNEIVNQFNSRNELIRAVLCCCYLPGLSGFTAPTLNGVRYIDGGFSNNVPLKENGSILVSSFSGDYDICPKYEEMIMLDAFNQKLELSLNNGVRMLHALLPPPSYELDQFYYNGYEDAENYLILNNV